MVIGVTYVYLHTKAGIILGGGGKMMNYHTIITTPLGFEYYI